MAHSHLQMRDRRTLQLGGHVVGAPLGLHRSAVGLIALLVALVVGCSDGTAASDSLSPSASAAIGASSNQTDAVANLVAAATAAWAAKDAAAYAALYSEDVVFIGPQAGILLGREGVRQQHA